MIDILKSIDKFSPLGVSTNDVISSSLLGDASYCPSVALLLTDKTKFAGDLKYTHALAFPDMVL